MKSPDLEVNVFVSMENVTERVRSAVKNAKTDQDQFAARKAILADIERESTEKSGLRSDIVTLYQGGEYWLYGYKKYTDVRIVFAPEEQVAFFGGDPDNFTYPRYDLDFALFRIYENGKPLENKNYLKWNSKGASENELVFVTGHPGSTRRLDTVAQLEFERDYLETNVIKRLKYRIAGLKAYEALGEEQARQASSRIFGLENAVKAFEGRYKGLLDKNVMDQKKRDEEEFKSKVMSNSEWKQAYGAAWDAIAEAMRKDSTRIKQSLFQSTDSQLGIIGETIVEYVAEIKKPDGERLDGYHEAQLDATRFDLFSPAPIYPAFEIARMTASLEQALQELGPDNPFVKVVLKGRSPKEAATEIVNGTKLADLEVRKKLVQGGESAVAASTDPMIVLQRFAVYGKNTYPDATFTLRLSYGQVKGYPMNGTKAPYKTTLYGLYDRAQSFDFKGPFALPSRYVAGRDKLDLSTPVDFVSTNDIVYSDEANRAVSVHTGVRKLYKAQRLAGELSGISSAR